MAQLIGSEFCKAVRKGIYGFAFFIIAFCLFSAQASAAPTCGVNYCADVLVKQLYVEASGNVYIQTNGSQGLLTCILVANTYMTIAASPTNQQIYSLILTAHLQQTPILVRVIDNSNGCTIAYATSLK